MDRARRVMNFEVLGGRYWGNLSRGWDSLAGVQFASGCF